jgi:hypothetical protein
MKERDLLAIQLEASPSDAVLLRSAAKALREDPATAARLRRLLSEALAPERGGMDLKELLESAPLEGVDLTRRKDLPRAVDL